MGWWRMNEPSDARRLPPRRPKDASAISSRGRQRNHDGCREKVCVQGGKAAVIGRDPRLIERALDDLGAAAGAKANRSESVGRIAWERSPGIDLHIADRKHRGRGNGRRPFFVAHGRNRVSRTSGEKESPQARSPDEPPN